MPQNLTDAELRLAFDNKPSDVAVLQEIAKRFCARTHDEARAAGYVEGRGDGHEEGYALGYAERGN